MEYIRDRVKVTFVEGEKELGKLENKPQVGTITRYSDKLIACHMKKKLKW